MRGERHHHGGHICGTFLTIPTVESYGAGVFVPARTLTAVKLLTAKSVQVGMKNSRSESFLLAKHLKHTAHKHHHHDGSVCPSSGMVLMEEHTPPLGLLPRGLGVAAVKGFKFIK